MNVELMFPVLDYTAEVSRVTNRNVKWNNTKQYSYTKIHLQNTTSQLKKDLLLKLYYTINTYRPGMQSPSRFLTVYFIINADIEA